jgi:3D (Asp-Asp-Asp) domain-containing protein
MKELLVIAVLMGNHFVDRLMYPVPHDVDCASQLANNPAIMRAYQEALAVEGEITLYCREAQEIANTVTARITGYYAEPGAKGATGKIVRPGGTAAVSRNCIGLLGSRVYIEGHGVYDIEDLTAESIGQRFADVCTVDLARATKDAAAAVGNEIKTVVKVEGK